MTDIQKFNPNDYVEALRAKIRGALLEVIPDEQWDKMVRAEIDSFFREQKRNVYSNTVRASGFKDLAHRLIREEAEKQIKEELKKPEWTATWSGEKLIMGEKIGALLVQWGPQILTSWISAAVAQAVEGMKR